MVVVVVVVVDVKMGKADVEDQCSVDSNSFNGSRNPKVPKVPILVTPDVEGKVPIVVVVVVVVVKVTPGVVTSSSSPRIKFGLTYGMTDTETKKINITLKYFFKIL